VRQKQLKHSSWNSSDTEAALQQLKNKTIFKFNFKFQIPKKN
jgi:hypothetical protein